MRILSVVLCSLILSVTGCSLGQPDEAATDQLEDVISTIQPDGRGGLESAVGPVERVSPERSQELFEQHTPSAAPDTGEVEERGIYGKDPAKAKCWFDGECNYCCHGQNCCGVCSDGIPFCG